MNAGLVLTLAAVAVVVVAIGLCACIAGRREDELRERLARRAELELDGVEKTR